MYVELEMTITYKIIFNISQMFEVKSAPLSYIDVYKHSWISNGITYDQIDRILFIKYCLILPAALWLWDLLSL
jgi:hypothetical protein